MKKYEYCGVSLETEYVSLLGRYVATKNTKVQAVSHEQVILEGKTFLEVFNKLGAEGWHLIISEPAKEKGDISLYYFERELS